jgi:hypothetical protein
MQILAKEMMVSSLLSPFSTAASPLMPRTCHLRPHELFSTHNSCLHQHEALDGQATGSGPAVPHTT